MGSDFALLGLPPQAVGLLLPLGDVPQALLQGGNLAQPLHPMGLLEPLMSVRLDLQQPGDPGQVEAKHRAADARMLVLEWGSAGPVAGAHGDLAEAEVVAEVGPFGVDRAPDTLRRDVRLGLVDEVSVVADDILGIDRNISLSGVEIEMAEYLGGDVARQPAVDGLGGEDPPEVVRGESQPRIVDVDDVGPLRSGSGGPKVRS